jgi:hypothetical protein
MLAALYHHLLKAHIQSISRDQIIAWLPYVVLHPEFKGPVPLLFLYLIQYSIIARILAGRNLTANGPAMRTLRNNGV